MPLPKIGITTSYEDGKQTLSHFYVDAIHQAGGLPIIVPMLQDDTAMRAFTELLDGLVITGGPGIVQGLIGDLPSDLAPVDPIRDKADKLAFNAIEDRPVLGICYGMQFINAQMGGSIYGDVDQHIHGGIQHSSGRGGTNHPIQIEADSRLKTILGRTELTTNTYHVQALAEVGSGLRAVGHSPDGVIEAIESADGRMIGLQFHPERMLDDALPIFQDFVERCQNAV